MYRFPVRERDQLWDLYIQCVPGLFGQMYSGRSVKLNTRLCPVPKLRISGAVTILLPYDFILCT
jgi:hypothetical protein